MQTSHCLKYGLNYKDLKLNTNFKMANYKKKAQIDVYEKQPENNTWVWIVVIVVVLILISQCS